MIGHMRRASCYCISGSIYYLFYVYSTRKGDPRFAKALWGSVSCSLPPEMSNFEDWEGG